MLIPAQLHTGALQTAFIKASTDPANKYFIGNYWDFSNQIADNTMYCQQFVSVLNDWNIIGFLSVKTDIASRVAYDFGAIKFLKQDKYNIVFAKDLKAFFLYLFETLKLKKLNFNVHIGSPHEKMYDRFVDRYGGRVVGVKKEDVMLIDGTICDTKIYEIFGKDLLERYYSKQ